MPIGMLTHPACGAGRSYMAPEQFRGQATPASDLYSLGATLLYLVSGMRSFALP